MPRKIKPVPGWITLAEAAEELGLSKQAVHKWVKDDKFKTLATLGKKRIYCVRPKEVAEIKAAREAVAQLRQTSQPAGSD